MNDHEKQLNNERIARFKNNNLDRYKEITQLASKRYRDKNRIKYCECGRELDPKCRYCSECSAVRREIKLDIYRHNWKKNNHQKVIADYNKQNAKKKLKRQSS